MLELSAGGKKDTSKPMFHYRDGQLFAENVPVLRLVEAFGSPLYVYSAADIRLRCRNFREAFASLQLHLHYSVKANGNLSLLRLLRDEGAGFDIVSGGELARLQAAEIDVREVSFAGVGKTDRLEAGKHIVICLLWKQSIFRSPGVRNTFRTPGGRNSTISLKCLPSRPILCSSHPPG